MRPVPAFAILLTVVILAACGDDPTGPEPATPCTPETTSVTVSVDAGAQVVFDWSPACGMAMVLVEPPDTASDTGDRWAIWSEGDGSGSLEAANSITPPLTYGVRPPGMVGENEPLELEPGREYELILWRALPEGASNEGCVDGFAQACIVAIHTFRR